MPVKILVTGFEPFGPDAVNAAWEAVSRLPEAIGGAEIVKRRLPVEYEAGPARLEALVEELAPDAVLSVGQAAGRAALTPELVGINWKDASLPDNAGVLCQGEPIDPDGADAHFSTLPVKEMVSAIRGAGVPAQLSLSAGGYLCNCLLYHLAGLAKERGIPGGFLHVPCCCEQVLDKPSCPSLPLPAITAGLAAALGVIAESLRKG